MVFRSRQIRKAPLLTISHVDFKTENSADVLSLQVNYQETQQLLRGVSDF